MTNTTRAASAEDCANSGIGEKPAVGEREAATVASTERIMLAAKEFATRYAGASHENRRIAEQEFRTMLAAVPAPCSDDSQGTSDMWLAEADQLIMGLCDTVFVWARGSKYYKQDLANRTASNAACSALKMHLRKHIAAATASPPTTISAHRMTEIARKWMKPGSESSPEFYWGDLYDCAREIIAAASQPAALPRAGDAAPRTHATQAGESLAGIALRQCGSANQWSAIVALNPEFSDWLQPDYFPVGTILQLPPLPAASPVVDDAESKSDQRVLAERFLTEDDAAQLFVFHSQMEDGDADGYTARKETMKRLAELGVVNSLGFGKYSTTAFGAWLVESFFEQRPSLPLRTVAEHNHRETAGHALYLNKSAPHSTAWVELSRDERESWRDKAIDAALSQQPARER